MYFSKGELKVQGYVNVNFEGEVDHRRSTTVTWTSQIQNIFYLSTTKVEYVAVTWDRNKFIWLRSFLTKLGLIHKSVLHSDSQNVIHLRKDSTFHSITRHIDLHYHFIESLLKVGVLTMRKFLGSEFTKYVDKGSNHWQIEVALVQKCLMTY